MKSSFVGGVDGGGFFIEVAEEVIERGFDVYVDRGADFDRSHFDVDAAGEEEGAGAEEEKAFTFVTPMVTRWNWPHRVSGRLIDRTRRSFRNAAIEHRFSWSPHR